MSEPEIRNILSDELAAPVTATGETDRPIAVIERHGVDLQFLEFFGLIEQPFGVTPDPRFLYLGAKHRQALDVLHYGTELNRGFLTLIAKPGMGKTSLLFQYLEGLRDKARTVFLFQTDCDSTDLMRYLLAELGIDGKGMDLREMRAVLNQVLLGEMEMGRRFVLVIDEAQNLDEKVLESIRLLSDFETPWMKLIHIVLAGQPKLAERLAKPSMEQLRQRVSFAARIEPFTPEEVDLYINHRLWVAGCKSSPLFSVGARALIAERSGGIPRNINNLCFCAMSYAWAMKRKTVERETVAKVLADMDPGSPLDKVDKKIDPEIPTPALQEKTNPVVARSAPPASLTLNAPPARSGLSTFVIVCLLGFTLGWFGLKSNVQGWFGSSFHSVSAAVKNLVVPRPAPVAPVAPPTTVREKSSSEANAEGLSEVKDIQAPQQVGETASSPK
jgi:general secretion pathway protein A